MNRFWFQVDYDIQTELVMLTAVALALGLVQAVWEIVEAGFDMIRFGGRLGIGRFQHIFCGGGLGGFFFLLAVALALAEKLGGARVDFCNDFGEYG